MRVYGMVAAFATFLAMAGCQNVPDAQRETYAKESDLYMTLDELSAAIAKQSGLVLVEFSVPSGCARCNQMREQIDRLATDEKDRLTIQRVNLNQQPGLAWELGIKVCPSYIAFRNGREVFLASHPASADLIAAGLDEQLQNQGGDKDSMLPRL